MGRIVISISLWILPLYEGIYEQCTQQLNYIVGEAVEMKL
jgi:hypothetical protein